MLSLTQHDGLTETRQTTLWSPEWLELIVFSFQSIYFIRQMVWNIFTISSKSDIKNFLFLHISRSLAVHPNLRNWNQLFCNRPGSYKIYVLQIFNGLVYRLHVQIFNCLVYRLHGTIDYLKKHIQPYWGPVRGFRDTGYLRKKLPGYGIFGEKVIGIQDIEK